MNKYNPKIHHRRSIRLKGYDYAQAGLYFITICCQNRACLFGDVVNGKMKLNDAGIMVENEWLKLPNRFQNIQLHEYVVMPNHFHAILEIVGATLVVAPVRVSLVDTPNEMDTQNETVAQNDDNSQKGQPQKGQPQGIASTMDTQNETDTQNDDNSQKGQPQKGQPQGIAPTGKTVGDMVGAFQSIATVEYIRGVKTLDWQRFDGKLWQRNYWEHIIRNEQSYLNISDYIINNPAKWADDKFYT
jgi:REP element-mobilizing transposase RayT